MPPASNFQPQVNGSTAQLAGGGSSVLLHASGTTTMAPMVCASLAACSALAKFLALSPEPCHANSTGALSIGSGK